MNPKEVKYLHFTNEEEIEYREGKTMLKNAIITLCIIIALISIVTTCAYRMSIDKTQLRYICIFACLSAIILSSALYKIITTKKKINRILNKY